VKKGQEGFAWRIDLRRNEVARRSHDKTWRAKHRGIKFLRL
jgi:hypothetical protein